MVAVTAACRKARVNAGWVICLLSCTNGRSDNIGEQLHVVKELVILIITLVNHESSRMTSSIIGSGSLPAFPSVSRYGCANFRPCCNNVCCIRGNRCVALTPQGACITPNPWSNMTLISAHLTSRRLCQVRPGRHLLFHPNW